MTTQAPTCCADGCESECASMGFDRPRVDGTRTRRYRRVCSLHQRDLDAASEKRRGACSVEGCTRGVHGRGLCNPHYKKMRRRVGEDYTYAETTGASHPNWLGDEISYIGAHGRVKFTKGYACNHSCVDCGGAAQDWSYVGGDPKELVGITGSGSPCAYSLNPDYYVPRCRQCHSDFDARHLRAERARQAVGQ